jgi:hypothetical protein
MATKKIAAKKPATKKPAVKSRGLTKPIPAIGTHKVPNAPKTENKEPKGEVTGESYKSQFSGADFLSRAKHHPL